MLKVEDGIVIPAGLTHDLERGGDHIMLMGVTRALKDGDILLLENVRYYNEEEANDAAAAYIRAIRPGR